MDSSRSSFDFELARAQKFCDCPVLVPLLGWRVLEDHSVFDVELLLSLAWPKFLDLLCVVQPLLHMAGHDFVAQSPVVGFGGWDKGSLSVAKHPLCRAKLVGYPGGLAP